MDLWIRSQDKKYLQEIKGFKINKTSIYGYSYTNKCIFLGKYETEERALEVLDEIQKFKDLLNHFKIFKQEESRFSITTDLLIKFGGKTTYTMPQE